MARFVFVFSKKKKKKVNQKNRDSRSDSPITTHLKRFQSPREYMFGGASPNEKVVLRLALSGYI
jgi:hypothetical protein